jgi:hypothetical protein
MTRASRACYAGDGRIWSHQRLVSADAAARSERSAFRGRALGTRGEHTPEAEAAFRAATARRVMTASSSGDTPHATEARLARGLAACALLGCVVQEGTCCIYRLRDQELP